jgi:hypothetical protein
LTERRLSCSTRGDRCRGRRQDQGPLVGGYPLDSRLWRAHRNDPARRSCPGRGVRGPRRRGSASLRAATSMTEGVSRRLSPLGRGATNWLTRRIGKLRPCARRFPLAGINRGGRGHDSSCTLARPASRGANRRRLAVPKMATFPQGALGPLFFLRELRLGNGRVGHWPSCARRHSIAPPRQPGSDAAGVRLGHWPSRARGQCRRERDLRDRRLTPDFRCTGWVGSGKNVPSGNSRYRL